MKSRFNLFRSPKDEQFYWNLMAPNNKIILQSEGYKNKQGAENGIESVRENSPIDGRYERLDSKDDKYYFVLKAKNGEPIGHSETYEKKANREKGIEAVKRYAPEAPVEDLTEKGEEAKTVSTTECAGGLVISSKPGKGNGSVSCIPVKPKGGYYGDF